MNILEEQKDRNDIRDVKAEDLIKSLFLTYAEETIVSRALVKAQDGLKPVQRYALYAMYRMGLKNSSLTRKCARVVGNTLIYSPHGDSSAYEAIIGLAQPWSKRYPLVTVQGNLGSIDNDPPAAMRYTECKLSKIGESLFDNMDKDAVPMLPNFDGTEKEPEFLPGLFPTLLANGTAGVATGLASKMAPHYAPDIFEAIKYTLRSRMERKDPDENELIKIVKAPDFPTGGIIMNPEEAVRAYKTGRGSIKIRAKYEIKDLSRGRQAIVFTEIPYGINKKSLVEDLGAKVYNENADKVFKDNVADVVDHSEKGKIAITVVLKKNANPDLVLNNIFRQTKMESSFSINNTVLINGRPYENVTLKQLIDEYCRHQLIVKMRVAKYELNAYQHRLEILNGYIKANEDIDAVIATIKSSKDHESVLENLKSVHGFTDVQAKAIDAKRLGSLNAFDVHALTEEKKDLETKINFNQKMIKEPKILIQELIKDIDGFMARGYFKKDHRRTEICHKDINVEERDLIPEEQIVMFYTHNGMVKCIRSKEYNSQNRGGTGTNIKLREGDFVEKVLHMSNMDDLLIVTEHGKAYLLPAYQVPIVSKAAMGKYLNNFVEIDDDDNIIKVLPVVHGDTSKQLLFVTKKGLAKRLSIEGLTIRKCGIRVITFNEGDTLASVLMTTPDEHIMAITHDGFALRTSTDNIRLVASRIGRGSTLMRFKNENDYIVAAVSVKEDDQILVITDNGFCKRCDVSIIKERQNKGGKGVMLYKPNETTGKVFMVTEVHEEETLFIVTSKNMVIRVPVKSFREQSRAGHGVRSIKLEDGVSIRSITPAPAEEEEEEENGVQQ